MRPEPRKFWVWSWKQGVSETKINRELHEKCDTPEYARALAENLWRNNTYSSVWVEIREGAWEEMRLGTITSYGNVASLLRTG